MEGSFYIYKNNEFITTLNPQNRIYKVTKTVTSEVSIHTNLLFTVYNRWGYVVHSKSGYSSDKVLWDGRVADLDNQYVSDGVYYYVLELFNTASKRQEYYSGYIHLFRGS